MVIRERSGTYTFRVYLPEARSVKLAGTFTGWKSQAIVMQSESTGWWSATIELLMGVHDFNYLVNDSQWVADYAASGIRRNGFGGWVSQINVESENPMQVAQPAVHLPRRFRDRIAA